MKFLMGGIMGGNDQTPAKLGEKSTGARILPHIPMDLEASELAINDSSEHKVVAG
jgi:hypothetical protein